MDFDFVVESITPVNSADFRITIDSVAALKVPTGAVGDRPTTPLTGDFRFSTTLGTVEWYNGTTWAQAATGTVTSVTVDGTANQIDSAGSPITTSGTITLTIPAVFIAPGTVQATSGFISAVAGLDYTTTLGNNLSIQPGAAATTTSTGNTASLTGGAGGSTSGDGGATSVVGGTPTAGAGGAVSITGAAGVGTNQNGGNVNLTSGAYTGTGTAGNVNVVTTAGYLTQSGGNFATAGDASTFVAVVRTTTTDATAGVVMFLDGTGGTKQLVVPNDTTWAFRIMVSARRADANDESAIYEFTGGVDRNATAATTAFTNVRNRTIIHEDSGTWNCDLTVDTTGGALRVVVTGQAAKTINWVARVEITQVTG